jgi:hypothetical protein
MTGLKLSAAVAAIACAMLPAVASAQNEIPTFETWRNPPQLQGAPFASATNHALIVGLWGGQTPSQLNDQGLTQAQALAAGQALEAFGGAANPSVRSGYQGATGSQRWITFEQDGAIGYHSAFPKPMYRPETWNEVRLRSYYGNVGDTYLEYADPIWAGWPGGLARSGAPTQVLQGRDENELIFLYGGGNLYRTIQVGTAPNCPQHDPFLSYEQLFWGHGVGCWMADGTLVVHTKGLAGDKMWFNNGGWYLTLDLESFETYSVLTGQGNNMMGTVLRRTQTLYDPNVLMQPWFRGVNNANLQMNRAAIIVEDVPYIERSFGNLYDGTYRG